MELSELLGFGMDQLYDIGNGEVPWAALRLAKPTGNVPLLMPAAAPPVLETGIYGGGGCGFSTIHINSRGGIGEGVRIRFEALDFDPDDWRFPVAALMPPGEDLPERSRRAFRTAPERRAFPKTGTRGWELIAPECPIARGMNPLRTGKYSRKLLDYDDHSGLLLYLVFVPMPGVKPRPFAFLPGGDPMRIRPTTPAIGTLRVAIAPLQNPEGGMSVDMRVWSWQGWASGTWWMGEYAGEVLDSLDRD